MVRVYLGRKKVRINKKELSNLDEILKQVIHWSHTFTMVSLTLYINTLSAN